jgi:hypothetical protein
MIHHVDTVKAAIFNITDQDEYLSLRRMIETLFKYDLDEGAAISNEHMIMIEKSIAEELCLYLPKTNLNILGVKIQADIQADLFIFYKMLEVNTLEL